ncbi:NAD-dependent succinate-semialdehyde dehydrogenase [Rhodococcus opacus]|uniref:NAD-dependent succinate-semialdehyde dehydrogenase n=1 Tax=Rhodococcus opacus TaxID=37919 RepID=UPI002475BFA5|nr:NAD-dependent succinate-semialdehyde dehydrogenase [Rhodococcus opacus]MDH6293393.1 succinate-semialdehyde dehydrogenase/glutarate-semialdehyde dehydrogenase [Rhodococcus opacus]
MTTTHDASVIDRILESSPTRLWLGTTATDASDGAELVVIDPATGLAVTQVADASVDDARRALDLAAASQASWAATPARTRGEILRTAFELVRDRSEHFAQIMSLEMGKTLRESRGEITYGAEFLRWFSEEAARINGRAQAAPAGNGQIVVTKEPIGPVLAVTPWNFPLAMGTRKIGPALAAGCTIIVKPARETPLTMLLLGQVFADAGLPDGVLSIIPTTRTGAVTDTLLGDPRLRKLTFTGSTSVGQHLIRQSADQLLRTSMELGGNAPFIVFDDANIDDAVAGALAAKMRNGGQACTAANRFYVNNAVIEEFTSKLSDAVSRMVPGPGLDEGSDIGPLVNAKQRDDIGSLVDEAIEAGARVRTGATAPDRDGFYYEPTVLDQIPANARILSEEIFGPIAVVVGFDTEDEAIAAANNTNYGLAAYFYTTDHARAQRVSAALDAGMIGINRGVISDAAAPFGGVKHSGYGREGGTEGIEEYLVTKYLAS